MRLVIKMIRERDGSYRAWCPALPGCSAKGADQQQVMDDLQQAIRVYAYGFDASVPWSTVELVSAVETSAVA